MRTLKKTLCLVLCLAMMVGLCAVGASAAKKLEDYPDKADIQHTEAVALLSAMGILEGDERGFRPNDTLTRAEAAKIITYMLGAQDAVAGRQSSFTDVRGTTAEWADPYFAYCEALGIIAGYGDGRVGPQDKLTNAAFAKMLLCALGYDAEREGMTGNAWEIGVAKLVNKTDLARDIDDFPYDGAISRDNAAQLAFNTLLQPMVEYKGEGLYVNANGTFENPINEIVNKSFSYMAQWNQEWYDVDEDDHEIQLLEFIENYFPRWKAHVDVDDYGMAVRQWFFANNRTDYAFDSAKQVAQGDMWTILATYTTNVSKLNLDTLYKDARYTKDYAGLALAVVENGEEVEYAWNAETQKWTGAIYPEKGNTSPVDAGVITKYAGATVKLVDTGVDGVGDTLIVQYPYLAMVTRVNAASGATARNVELMVYNRTGNGGAGDNAYKTTAFVNNVVFETEDFGLFDMILIYPAETIDETGTWTTADEFKENIIEAKKADTAAGALSRVNTSTANGKVTSLNLDSTTYSLGGDKFAVMGPDNVAPFDKATVNNLGAQLYSLGVNYTLYLSNGYVIGAKGDTKPLTDYYFVYGVVPGEEDPFSGVSEKVGLVKYDASTEIVTLAASQIGDEDEFEELWATRTATGSSYKFKAAPDQTKLYTAVVDTASPVIAGVDENDAAASFKTDANTVFIVRSGATRAFAAYTGVNNMPKFDKDDIADLNDGKGALAVAYSRLGTAALVFLDFGEISASNTNAKPIFILSEKYKATELDGTTPIYLYDAIGTTGEIITIKTRDAALASGLIIPSYDSKGYLVADESEAATAENPAVILDGRVDKNGGHEVWKNRYITYRNSVLTTAYNNELGAESQSYTVAPDCTLYYYKSGKVTVYTDISQIDGVWGNLALVGLDENNQRVTTIYYYAQSKPTNI